MVGSSDTRGSLGVPLARRCVWRAPLPRGAECKFTVAVHPTEAVWRSNQRSMAMSPRLDEGYAVSLEPFLLLLVLLTPRLRACVSGRCAGDDRYSLFSTAAVIRFVVHLCVHAGRLCILPLQTLGSSVLLGRSFEILTSQAMKLRPSILNEFREDRGISMAVVVSRLCLLRCSQRCVCRCCCCL